MHVVILVTYIFLAISLSIASWYKFQHDVIHKKKLMWAAKAMWFIQIFFFIFYQLYLAFYILLLHLSFIFMQLQH